MPIGVGSDSEVYRHSEGTVLKNYSQLQNHLGDAKTMFVLEKYRTDTLKARKILEEEVFDMPTSFEMDGKRKEITAEIVPQGELVFEDETYCLVGQKEIWGERLREFGHWQIKENIQKFLSEVNCMLVKRFTPVFRVDPENVKVFLRYEGVDLKITDLSPALACSYKGILV